MPRLTFSEEIRREIAGCGVSRYRISKVAEVTESTLSKFMAGSGMDFGALDRVASTIGLSVSRKPEVAQRSARSATRPGRPASRKWALKKTRERRGEKINQMERVIHGQFAHH